MSLRDRLREQEGGVPGGDLYSRFGVLTNPFPSSNQTANNPHFRLNVDDEVDARIVSFLRDNRSQVVVIEGTQGVGKTNYLGFYEEEIQAVLSDRTDFYVVRYLADPEASFEGTIRRLFQELGIEHLRRLGKAVAEKAELLEMVRGQDMRLGLASLSKASDEEATAQYLLDWLLGFRLLKAQKDALKIQFRLDTVESKTAALRDLVVVSSAAGLLNGIFLLLDELEKQDGVLGPTAVVRYLSAMRAIIDALPNHLFMMIAVTPDAMRRYSSALPAFRSRLQNQISLSPLMALQEGIDLASFYVSHARTMARQARGVNGGSEEFVSQAELAEVFEGLRRLAERRGDAGVRQREFLNQLHTLAERKIQQPA